MKQTAVEWLVEQICGDHTSEWQKQIDQAKAMEKEQIMKHSLELAKILISNPYETTGKMPTELIDSYINETFKSE
jgi:hypothetical protein